MSIRQNLWKDDLSQVELTPLLAVASSASLHTAIEAMRNARVGGLLVCEGDQLVGIFTERDYIKRVLAVGADLNAPIREYMTPEPVTAKMTDLVGSVIRTMQRGHYRHLPVVDENGRPVGSVSVKRIIEYLVDHFPSTVYNLPPQPGQLQSAREGA